MKYQKYIISFVPGSSGRFIGSVLNRLLIQSTDPIPITESNSVHTDNNYLGINVMNPHNPDVYDTLYFDRPKRSKKDNFIPPQIFTTHVYPDFDKINQKFNDIGIILVKLNNDDYFEVMFNSYLKNKNIKLRNMNIQQKKWTDEHVNFLNSNNFLGDKLYPDNCLIINYSEIFQVENNEYNLVKKLMDFCRINTIPEGLIESCDRYFEGRSILINQYGLR